MKSTQKNDNNGLEYKYVELDQYDSYDHTKMYALLKKYDKRIGSLLIIFSELEQTLDMAIAVLINDRTDDLGLRVLADLTFRNKINLFYRICSNYLFVTDRKLEIKKLKLLQRRLELISEIRNIIAHAKWMSLDPDGFVRSKINLNDSSFIHFKYYKLTPRVLYNIERKINKLDCDFSYFLIVNDLA